MSFQTLPSGVALKTYKTFHCIQIVSPQRVCSIQDKVI
jgi:hypothetical protein